jgi:hypothetical protein
MVYTIHHKPNKILINVGVTSLFTILKTPHGKQKQNLLYKTISNSCGFEIFNKEMLKAFTYVDTSLVIELNSFMNDTVTTYNRVDNKGVSCEILRYNNRILEVDRCKHESKFEVDRCKHESKLEVDRCKHESKLEVDRCKHESKLEVDRCKHESKLEVDRCKLDLQNLADEFNKYKLNHTAINVVYYNTNDYFKR